MLGILEEVRWPQNANQARYARVPDKMRFEYNSEIISVCTPPTITLQPLIRTTLIPEGLQNKFNPIALRMGKTQ